MVVFTFSVLDRKYHFKANLVQKFKIVSSSWNLVSKLIRICRIQWWCSLFLPGNGNTVFRQIWPKNQDYQFKLKFGLRLTNLCRIQWRCPLFPFILKIPFLGKFDSKNRHCQFKLKFCTKFYSNIQKLMEIFILFAWDRKSSFSANLVQKIKIVSLTWNLVPRLIWIWKTQWWC